ncbi:MAG: tRNA glutamyl-Q(34) synthetase GluQRS [Actinomycetota bacterium]|nr:tRNA glutamyl-Q(34) synthetase GluQRS [Actinomycetota bacterium]
MSGRRGRYAPSPTGDLHLGNLRTALIAWLCARSAGSEFLLRIEDLDSGRVRPEFLDSQLRDLSALGIDWDGEPVRQSQRTSRYATALDRLRDQGFVYPCFCSRREVREAASASHETTRALYPGTCATLTEAEARRRVAAGDPYALRLRAGRARVDITDERHGPRTDVADDIVLRRRDRDYAYNLAVVVDDADQGIAEVVRGDDLLSSTPDQAFICDLLGLPRPRWFHVPLALGADGERLAKRHGSVTLADLAARGIDVTQVRSLLAQSLGLANEGEAVEPTTLLARFDRAALPTGSWTLGAGSDFPR